jgi:hypothetical protein
MDINSRMMDIVKGMLIEAKLDDIFNSLTSTHELKLITTDGEEKSFQIMSNMIGKLIVRDSSDGSAGTMYIIDKTSLNDDDLVLWKYDKENATNEFKGEEVKLELEKFGILNNKSGNLENIELSDPRKEANIEQNVSRIPEYNEIIKDLNKGDVLKIMTETEGNSEEDGDNEDTIVNVLYLTVNGFAQKGEIIRFQDLEVEGNREDEISPETQRINSIIGNSYVFIGGPRGFFKRDGDDVILDLLLKGNKVLTIKGIIDVNNDSIESDIDYDRDDKNFSKKELQQALLKDKTFQKMMRKQPGLLDTLKGASPLGLMQLKNLMQKYGVQTSYLKKGNHVKFKLLSNTIRTGDMRHKLLNRDGYYYEAKVSDENTLKMGSRGRGNWEINLLDEIESNTYRVEVIYCETDGTCKTLTKKGVIKILTNG